MSYLLGSSSLQPQYFASQLPDCLTVPSPCQPTRLNGKQHTYTLSAQSFCTSVPFGLPTNVHYTSSISGNGEISGSSFPLSYFFCTTLNFELLRPVCFPTYWINYSSTDLYFPYCHSASYHLSLRHCHIALDFSKAFDTVRHSTLLEKMADLAMPDGSL